MPTTDSPWPDGTPCWVDYAAPDPDGARAFYSDVFGWTWTVGGEEYGGYSNAFTHGRDAAGLAARMDESQPARWLTYIATADAEAAAARVTAAGGTVLYPPMTIGPVGTVAVAVDPQGQAFGLWQAGQHIGVRIYNEPGALVWNDAAFDDPDVARTFYATVFGWAYDEFPDMGGYTTFRTAEQPLGGIGALQPGAPAGWTACFSVASVDDTVAAVEAGGGKVLAPPADMSFGRFALVEDPWGAPFSVMQELPG